jgi:hypothetical protein
MNSNDILSSVINQPILAIEGLKKRSERIVFRMMTGNLILEHQQDCCEHVAVEDLEGDAEDLVGQVLLHAEEVVNGKEAGQSGEVDDYSESFTWTFYKFRTTGGDLWVRWLGESNGYYSERVTVTWEPLDDMEN